MIFVIILLHSTEGQVKNKPTCGDSDSQLSPEALRSRLHQPHPGQVALFLLHPLGGRVRSVFENSSPLLQQVSPASPASSLIHEDSPRKLCLPSCCGVKASAFISTSSTATTSTATCCCTLNLSLGAVVPSQVHDGSQNHGRPKQKSSVEPRSIPFTGQWPPSPTVPKPLRSSSRQSWR